MANVTSVANGYGNAYLMKATEEDDDQERPGNKHFRNICSSWSGVHRVANDWSRQKSLIA